MRVPAASLVALALLFPAQASADARDDIARELIVALRPAPAGDSRSLARSGVGPLFAALRLSMRAPLEIPGPHGLDRVWLLAAADSHDASYALDRLARDPRVAWVERNAPRDPAVWRLADVAPLRRAPLEAAIPGTPPADRATAGTRRYAEPEPPGSIGERFPNDPMFLDGRQWGLDQRDAPGTDVRALDAWRIITGSNDVLLALADTGIDPTHPELAGTLPDGRPRIHAPLDIVAGLDVSDFYGHGTPVAGVMAARTHDGPHFDSLGVAGVCGGDGVSNAGCRIVPIKITRSTGGLASSFDIAAAVLYATRHGARAVNVSFTGTVPSRLERLALHEAITHGCVVVAAAGNRGFRDGLAPLYPAAYSKDGLCVQVGASDRNDRRASFSSYGPGLDLLAPGVDVWTTFMTYPAASGTTRRAYVSASGTSFAAPFVTGGIGLLAAARPELIDTDFQNVLRASAHDVGDPGVDRETGAGRLDLANALALVSADIGIWHDERAADTFELLERDTLTIGEPGLGSSDRAGRFAARLVRASVTLAIPDSFPGPVRMWPRVSGTTTLRAGFVLDAVVPWAEVVTAGERRFTLSGYAYQLEDGAASSDAADVEVHVPLPLDQLRFGFTVMGRVERPPVSGVPTAPAAPSDRTSSPGFASPNPFRVATRISVPDARTIEIWDVSGRRVRRLAAGGSVGAFVWNGTDETGRVLGPGVFLVRARGVRGERSFKLLKLN